MYINLLNKNIQISNEIKNNLKYFNNMCKQYKISKTETRRTNRNKIIRKCTYE